jgi:DNA modification methylase/rubredoxin
MISKPNLYADDAYDNNHKQDDSSNTVQCLGREFSSDQERREYFREELRKKLQDPDFRSIEGFPLGSDEDILALSDPPYYTACPNPWIQEFVKEWEKEKPIPEESYHKPPYAFDVSEGKNDPIYNAHSYHTKVPHKAIMRYILHYTNPGDIVFDGFCGTGMTGVAAQLCGNKEVVESLGISKDSPEQKYKVIEDNTILERTINEKGEEEWVPFSKLGARHAVLNDLSPAATFIAYNYNTPVDIKAFEKEAKRILEEVEQECGWMYETKHPDGSIGKINYTVWSDVFVCPSCLQEVVFWDAAVDQSDGKVNKEFPCPHCGATLEKRSMNRAFTTFYDEAIKETIKQAKQVPVLINYTIGKKRYEKKPDSFDLALIQKIEKSDIPYWFPTDKIQKGDKTGEPLRVGITHVHHFYTKRNLWVSSYLWLLSNDHVRFLISSFVGRNLMKTNRCINKGPGRPLTGTLYIPSEKIEQNPSIIMRSKISSFNWDFHRNPISTLNMSRAIQKNNFLDYIFLDPPFGGNLMYSELNFIWESWLKVWTNNKSEAIVNKTQGKGLNEYSVLMTKCFQEAYRILKPGRWMTVEFSNTQASVWNGIRKAITNAGFIIANVSILDKQHGGIKSMTYSTAVKQDLVISAYKPNGGFSDRFEQEATSEKGVWDFIRTHLSYLNVIKIEKGKLEYIPERDARTLFDQVVKFYVRNNFIVPLSSIEFQEGLKQRFPERDGMYFLSNQAVEYDKARMRGLGFDQGSMFIDSEQSAIQWLKNRLNAKPQTFQDINTEFMQEMQGWKQPLELSLLLEQNFLQYEGENVIPPQLVSYLRRSEKYRKLIEAEWQSQGIEVKENQSLVTKNKEILNRVEDLWYVPDVSRAADLEKVREKALLREFNDYLQSKGRLQDFRLEAVRAGFKKAWQENNYETIVSVADRIPHDIVESDDQITLFYDSAKQRLDQ